MTDPTTLPLFRDYKGDEVGGTHAIRGFTFQVWWAVLEAIKCHAGDGDYAVVLEWQQDVAVLNSSKTPDEVRFVQIKKNESSLHWSLSSLIDTPPSKPVSTPAPGAVPKLKTSTVSILGKLYAHRRRFTGLKRARLAFVSNAPFTFGHPVGSSQPYVEQVSLGALTLAERTRVTSKFRAQLSIDPSEVVDLADIELEVTNCPLDEPNKHVTGELVESVMLNKIKGEVRSPMVATLMIANYVQMRAGKRSFAKDLPALLKRGVTRAEVDSYLAAANDLHVTVDDLVEEIIDRLNAEVAPFGLVKQMRREINRACMDVTNRASPVWVVLRSLHEVYAQNGEFSPVDHIKDVLALWMTAFKKLEVSAAAPYKDGYLYCLMAMIVQDAKPIQHLQSFSTDSKSEDKQ